MSEHNIKDVIKMASDGNASDFKDEVGSMLMNKIQDEGGMKKAEVDASFMSVPEVEPEVEVEAQSEEEEDVN